MGKSKFMDELFYRERRIAYWEEHGIIPEESELPEEVIGYETEAQEEIDSEDIVVRNGLIHTI
jgi:hypothetical protein